MKLISRFIVWYLKRHYELLECKNYIVRMYTKEHYEEMIEIERIRQEKEKELRRGGSLSVDISADVYALAQAFHSMAETAERFG